MAKLNIAIDLGTSYTTIYLENQGVVLREPSVIAYTGKDSQRKFSCVGYAAAEMQGKEPDNTTIVRPIVEGYVTDVGAASMMLGEFIKKIDDGMFTNISAILAVPTGLTITERKNYGDVCYSAGVCNLEMVDNIVLSAIAMDLPVSSSTGSLVVNIGGGSTEIALVALSGINTGCAVTIGGDMMDSAISDFVVGKYGLRIGRIMARKAKEEVGSLYPNDSAGMEVTGVNAKTLVPATCMVYATDIYEALLPYYQKLAEAVGDVIKTLGKSFAEDLKDRGVFVTGGAAKMLGMEKVFTEVLGLPVHVSKTPDYSAVVGGGKLIGNVELLHKLVRK